MIVQANEKPNAHVKGRKAALRVDTTLNKQLVRAAEHERVNH